MPVDHSLSLLLFYFYFIPPNRPVGHSYCERVGQETFPYGPAARVVNPAGCRLIREDDEVELPLSVAVEGNNTGGQVVDPRDEVRSDGIPRVEEGSVLWTWMVYTMVAFAVLVAGE